MEIADADLSPEAIIKACRAALAANEPEDKVAKRLRAIEAKVRPDRALYAQWLIAMGIATNRLSLRGEALGDLNEAADIFAQLNDGTHAAEAKREAAVVHAWSGEGREAGLALLRALAESIAAKDMTGAALALFDAGRLELEMGRPQAAAPLFDRGLRIEGADPPIIQRRRAEVGQLQALVEQARTDARMIDKALQFRQAIAPDLASATKRLHLLVAIEEIRCAYLQGRFAEAHQRVEAARLLLPDEPDVFDAVELAEVEAELALAEGDFKEADAKIAAVIACFVDRDLAGREVKARLLWAKALDALGRHEEAERNLSKALRRAVMRGLIGHADQVRAAFAACGGSENMTALDELVAGSGGAGSHTAFRAPAVAREGRSRQRVSRL